MVGSRTLALLVLVSLSLLCVESSAHDVNINDNAISEWSERRAATANSGIVIRTDAGSGEYIWRDDDDDHISIVESDDLAVNLLSFSITASPTGLGLLLEVPFIPSPGQEAGQFQIAIDVDGTGGEGAFLGNAETNLHPEASWEYLVMTRFGTGQPPFLYQGSSPGPNVAHQIVVSTTTFLELSIPWSQLGLSAPPTDPIRFSLASFITDANDQIIDNPNKPNALDAATDYGRPGYYAKTSSEFFESGDDRVDYAMEVHFDSAGEVYAPLVVFGLRPDPVADTTEWIAIRNQTQQTIQLEGHKVGDEEDPNEGEGMVAFPAGVSVPAGEVVVVAVDGALFLSEYQVAPDAEITGGSGAPIMDPFTEWGSSNISLNNMGDQVLVLDRWNTVIDVITYGSGSDSLYPGVSTGPTLGKSGVAVRDAIGSDTDNCANDFVISTRSCEQQSDCNQCDLCLVWVCVPNVTDIPIPCDDQDDCTFNDLCESGTCAGIPLQCDSDQCVTRACNGTAQCAETFMPSGTNCGSYPCESDVCSGSTWLNYPETCALSCDGAGSCESSCVCPPAPEECQGSGCCVVSCSDSTGCFTEAGACTGSSDSCSDQTLVVGTVCTGCGANGVEGLCQESGQTFTCDATTHMACQTQTCGGLTYYCTEIDEAWAWRTPASCDDGDLCTYGDTCQGGTCQGTSLTCEGEPCLERACDGTSTCLVSESPVSATCSDPSPCPASYCSGTSFYSYPDTCAAHCDGAGSCDDSCICEPTPQTCEASGCCEAYCDKDAGCLSTPTSCGGNEVCEPGVLSIESACLGCGLAGASGACSSTPVELRCEEGSEHVFSSGLCNGDLYFCTNADGQWAWRMAESCDDNNPCTIEDEALAGVCQGLPVADATPCQVPCIDSGSCIAGICKGPDTCGQSDTFEPQPEEEEDLNADTGSADTALESDEEVKVCGSCDLRVSRRPSSGGLYLAFLIGAMGWLWRRRQR